MDNFRQFFFQTVSNSRWAHAANLVVALPISEEIEAELRGLGNSHNVNVISYNINYEALYSLPFNANEILELPETKFEEEVLYRLNPTEKYVTRVNDGTRVDWFVLDGIIKEFAEDKDMQQIFLWISSCLDAHRALQFKEFRELYAEYKSLPNKGLFSEYLSLKNPLPSN
jgi:hypothetical protein